MFNKSVFSKKHENPWRIFQNDFSDLLNRFSSDWQAPLVSTFSHFVPRIDVMDLNGRYLITAEIPGMKESEINLSLGHNILTIEGEKKLEPKIESKGQWRSEISYGPFYRSIPLADEVDETQSDATYNDGVLKIILKKKEGAEKQSRRITIGKMKEVQH
jgi:HSP20 family protein